MKHIIIRQYQDIIDNAAKKIADLSTPPEGWVRTMRGALGMSGAQLARLLNVSRSQVTQTEKNELAGVVTLKTLENAAEVMGCKFVYAIVPNTSAKDLVKKQAMKKVKSLIAKADVHMALEDQALTKEQHRFEIERLQRELMNEMPFDLWNND
jgi:predicted DNA-binding mobile mystery protein A